MKGVIPRAGYGAAAEGYFLVGQVEGGCAGILGDEQGAGGVVDVAGVLAGAGTRGGDGILRELPRVVPGKGLALARARDTGQMARGVVGIGPRSRAGRAGYLLACGSVGLRRSCGGICGGCRRDPACRGGGGDPGQVPDCVEGVGVPEGAAPPSADADGVLAQPVLPCAQAWTSRPR